MEITNRKPIGRANRVRKNGSSCWGKDAVNEKRREPVSGRGRRRPTGALVAVIAVAAVIGALSGRLARAQDESTPTLEPSGGMQQSKIRLMAHVGFDPTLAMSKQGCWTRIAVLIENQWKSVDGVLRIQKMNAVDETLIYEQPLDLPKNSRKLWTGYILADDDRSLQVEYYSGRRKLASEPVSVMTRHPGDVLVMAKVPELSRRDFGYLTIRGGDVATPFRAVPYERRMGRNLLFTENALLPHEVIGYNSISAFLWDGGLFEGLDQEQVLALKSWVYMGGTLIVAAGDSAAAVRQSFLSEILPVDVIGPRSAVLDEEFEQAYGSSPGTGEPRIIGLATVRQGEVLMGSGGSPLIVEGRYGVGRVVYVAFSLGSWDLKNWGDRDAMLEDLFRPVKPRLLNQLSGEARLLVDSRMKNNLLAVLPSALFIVGFLGIYIILVVPVNYAVFRLLKRVEYAWVALPIIAIAFGLLAYNIGYVKQSKTLDADEVTLVEGVAGCPVVTAKTFFSLYSPTRMNQPLRFPDNCVFARPMMTAGIGAGGAFNPSAASGRNALQVTFDKGFEVFDFLIHPWAARSFESDYVADLGGQIDAHLALQGDGNVSGTLVSNLGYTLNNVVLLTPGGGSCRMGSLYPGRPVNMEQVRGNRYELTGWVQAVVGSALRPRRPMGRAVLRGPVPPAFYVNQMALGLFEQSSAWQGQSWFSGLRSDLVGEHCLLIASSGGSLLEVEVGKPRSLRNINRKARTMLYFIRIPTEEAPGVSWTVERHIRDNYAMNQIPPQAFEQYYRHVNAREGIHMLEQGENVLSINARGLHRPRNLDSLEIRHMLERYYWAQDRVEPMTSQDASFALYDFDRQTWKSLGSESPFYVSQGAAPYYHRGRREIRLRVDVKDKQDTQSTSNPSGRIIQPPQPNWQPCVFLRNLNIVAEFDQDRRQASTPE